MTKFTDDNTQWRGDEITIHKTYGITIPLKIITTVISIYLYATVIPREVSMRLNFEIDPLWNLYMLVMVHVIRPMQLTSSSDLSIDGHSHLPIRLRNDLYNVYRHYGFIGVVSLWIIKDAIYHCLAPPSPSKWIRTLLEWLIVGLSAWTQIAIEPLVVQSMRCPNLTLKRCVIDAMVSCVRITTLFTVIQISILSGCRLSVDTISITVLFTNYLVSQCITLMSYKTIIPVEAPPSSGLLIISSRTVLSAILTPIAVLNQLDILNNVKLMVLEDVTRFGYQSKMILSEWLQEHSSYVLIHWICDTNDMVWIAIANTVMGRITMLLFIPYENLIYSKVQESDTMMDATLVMAGHLRTYITHIALPSLCILAPFISVVLSWLPILLNSSIPFVSTMSQSSYVIELLNNESWYLKNVAYGVVLTTLLQGLHGIIVQLYTSKFQDLRLLRETEDTGLPVTIKTLYMLMIIVITKRSTAPPISLYFLYHSIVKLLRMMSVASWILRQSKWSKLDEEPLYSKCRFKDTFTAPNGFSTAILSSIWSSNVIKLRHRFRTMKQLVSMLAKDANYSY